MTASCAARDTEPTTPADLLKSAAEQNHGGKGFAGNIDNPLYEVCTPCPLSGFPCIFAVEAPGHQFFSNVHGCPADTMCIRIGFDFTMLYDFHVHTSQYSPCAVDPAEAMCRSAAKAGLTGVALTEHDAWRPNAEIEALQTRFPELTIFQGVEYSCHEGHFLVFLPDPRDARGLTTNRVLKLIKAVHRRDGIVIWAHPFRFDPSILLPWLDAADLDGVETASGNMNSRMSNLARGVADLKGVMGFRNSDAHHVDALGKYYNSFEKPLKTAGELIRFVKKRNDGLKG